MSQVKPTDEILCRLNVTYKAQKRQMSCWYASAKMVLSFRTGSAKGLKKDLLMKTDVGKDVHAQMKSLSSPVGAEDSAEQLGATEKEWPKIAQAFGLTPVEPGEVNRIGTNFLDLREALVRKGPLWCAGRFFQGGSPGGHVIVVTGVLRRKIFGGQIKDHVIFHDPAPASLQGGDECVKPYDRYFMTTDKSGLFSLMETEGVPPVMYAPADAPTATN